MSGAGQDGSRENSTEQERDEPMTTTETPMTDDDLYAKAKDDPAASIILSALHTQDAYAYNGHGIDNLAQRAYETLHAVEEVIRADERRRLAALFEENAETLGGSTGEGSKTVQLVAFMLRLKDDS